MRDKEAIRLEIAKLGLPPVVLQIFDGAAPRPALKYRCQDPYYSLGDGSGFSAQLLPLWECGTTVTAFDTSDRTFCQVSLEALDEPFFRGVQFDGVAADLLIDLWEDEIPDAELSELAALFGFGRFQQLVAALERGSKGDYSEWRAALRNNSSEQADAGNPDMPGA